MYLHACTEDNLLEEYDGSALDLMSYSSLDKRQNSKHPPTIPNIVTYSEYPPITSIIIIISPKAAAINLLRDIRPSFRPSVRVVEV